MNLISQTHDKHILQSKQIREMVFSNIFEYRYFVFNEGGGAEGTKFFHFFPHDAVFFDISPLDQEKKMTTPWS